MKTLTILLIGFAFYACGSNEPQAERPVSQATSPQQQPNITDVAAKATEPTPVTGEPSNAATVVPQFSRKNLYELPRAGKTIKVFAKIITEEGDDYEVSEKGKKLYDLVWS